MKMTPYDILIPIIEFIQIEVALYSPHDITILVINRGIFEVSLYFAKYDDLFVYTNHYIYTQTTLGYEKVIKILINEKVLFINEEGNTCLSKSIIFQLL